MADNATINLNRVSAMRARNAISQKELDNARSSDRSARAELRSAQEQLDMLLSGYREEEVLAQRAAVDAAAAALELAEIRLRDALLTAPQDGIVLTRAREAGAIVQAGQTVYTLSLVDPVWLRIYVDEPQLGRIKPGMAVRVRVDAVPDKEFSGRVGFISPAAEFTPKSVETMEVRTSLVYRLRVQVDDPDNVMRQGMPVTVTPGGALMSFWSAWWRRRAAGAPDTARSAYGRADGDDRSGKAGRQAAATPEAVQDAATPQGGIAVELRGLAMRFGAVEALRGLDARIPAGRITGLVGPDGAGKTTLLRLLAGLMGTGGGAGPAVRSSRP